MVANIVVLCDVRDCSKIDKETRSFCTGGTNSKIHINRLLCQEYVMDKAYLDSQLKEYLKRRVVNIPSYAKPIERITTKKELDAILYGPNDPVPEAVWS